MRVGDFELRSGERFGCITLGGADVDAGLPSSLKLDANVWALNSNPFPLSNSYRDGLGRFLIDDVNNARLVIVAVNSPDRPGAAGATEEDLTDLTYHYYRALQFFGVPRVQRPFGVSGTLGSDKIRISRWFSYVAFRFNENRVPMQISAASLTRCKPLVEGLQMLESGKRSGRCWRLFYGLHVFFDALGEFYMDDRLLQLVRSLDAVLKTPRGGGRREFVRRMRAVVFGSKSTRVALEEMYELRNASAHMYDWAAVLSPKYPRSHKQVAAKRALGAELLAIYVWRRILENASLLNVLTSDTAIDAFWRQGGAVLRKAWGRPFPLQKAVKEAYLPRDE